MRRRSGLSGGRHVRSTSTPSSIERVGKPGWLVRIRARSPRRTRPTARSCTRRSEPRRTSGQNTGLSRAYCKEALTGKSAVSDAAASEDGDLDDVDGGRRSKAPRQAQHLSWRTWQVQAGGAAPRKREHQADQRPARGSRNAHERKESEWVTWLPEHAVRQVVTQPRVTLHQQCEMLPAPSEAQGLDEGQRLDSVVHHRVRHRAQARCGLVLTPQEEVGVLAGRDRTQFVETIDEFEQTSRIGNVAGLRVHVRRVDALGSRVHDGLKQVLLVRIRRCRSLQHGIRFLMMTFQERLQPAWVGAAVIVGERDQRGFRAAPPGVAFRRGGGTPRSKGHVAESPAGPKWVIIEERLGFWSRRVVHDNHVPPLGVQGLRLERIQQPQET